jgi:cation:H+ antiporter
MLFFALAIMVMGAELLVRGASGIAAMLGVSQLVIGLTIVSLGTSAPEFVVSIKGVLTNHSDLVVGNCIGSNIFNVLFIIGACAVVIPLVVTKQLIKLDVPIMIASNLFFLLLSLDGRIDRSDALLLLTSFALYYGFIIRKSLQENSSITNNNLDASCNVKSICTLSAIIKQIGLITIGLILCISGAGWTVESAVMLARIFGVSELIIGLTIISIGTSLPEVVTSIVATIRGRRDIAIGNVVGSCIFNILGVAGVAGLIEPSGIAVASSVLRFDLPVMIAASLACLPVFFTDYKISRWEGFLFLFYYMAYIAYLLLDAEQHDVLPIFSLAMLWFTIPLTALTLAVIVYRSIRSN